MEAWRQQLRPRAGQSRLRRGWRMARGSWRLLVAERSVRELALAAGALSVALLLAWVLAARGIGAHGRLGDFFFLELAWVAVSTPLFIFVFAALCSAVDAVIDGTPIAARTALGDARDRLGPLLIAALLWIGVWVVMRIVAYSVNGLVIFLAWYAWAYLAAFTLPALVLSTESVASALAASLRTVRRRWREALAGFVRVFLFGWLAGIPVSIAANAVARHHPDGLYSSSGWWPIAALLALGAIVAALVSATTETFALILYRDAEGDLPALEPLPPKPRSRRRTALRVAAVVLAILFLLFLIGRLTHRRDEQSASASRASTHLLPVNRI